MMRRLFFLSWSLVIFWLEGWIISCADAQDTSSSLNMVFDEGECNGSQPTVAVSTRLGRRVSIHAVRPMYTRWIPLSRSDNCSAAQNLTFSLSAIFNGTILDTVANPHYQFRIDLSPADHCHCLTVDSATGVIGKIIFNQWRDGSFWCGSNTTQLCASNSENTTFYSVLISQNGSLPRDDHNDSHLCDNSTALNISIDAQVSKMINCSIIPETKCTTVVDAWKEAPKCSISRKSDLQSCSYANATRVCHCNGMWGPVHCHPSLQLVEELLESSLPEDSLVILSQLLLNTTTITQRLDLLMRAVQQQLNSTQGITDTFLQLFLNIVEDIPNKANVTDSSFLTLLDDVALNLRRNRTVSSKNDLIRVRIREVFPGSGRVTGIQVDNNYITLPGEIFEDVTESVFVASYYFENISNLLPEGAQEPVSSVISSALNCNIGCKTINITENVTIFFNLSLNTTNNIKCVFINLQKGVDVDFWNDSGCSTINFENGSVMCSCNHLTHFGILTSGAETSPQTSISILVVRVLLPFSLVFLLATILTFVLQRSLWNMRNYIHCMLCGSMFTAQFVYVVGIEQTENEAVCVAITVLEHYLLLVMSMWMLMEGVVLYVKLFKVFIKHHKRYIAVFTIASYGIPLLYMILVVPLGLLVNTENIVGSHYGRRDPMSGQLIQCWLRFDTNYIWALVAPAFLIILVNIGFMIMTFVIMCRHLKKIEKRNTTKHVLKVTISLIIITGIVWISNLVFIQLTYIPVMVFIVNAFVSCQGIIIFIVLVPLSKQVRDAYINWWRKKWPHAQLKKSSVKRFLFPFPPKCLTSCSTKETKV